MILICKRTPIHEGRIKIKKSSGMKRPIVEEANYLWAPLLLLIDKNDGTKRLVVDFRKLKKITRKNI